MTNKTTVGCRMEFAIIRDGHFSRCSFEACIIAGGLYGECSFHQCLDIRETPNHDLGCVSTSNDKTPAKSIVAGWLMELWIKRPEWLVRIPSQEDVQDLIDRIDRR